MLGKDRKSIFNINEKRKALTEKKLLLQVEKDIKKLEHMIKHPFIYNPGISFKRTSKISLRTVQLIYPYLVFPSVLYGSLWFGLNFNPFTSNNNAKVYLKNRTTTDNYGNVYTESQYEKFNDDDDLIKYHSVWNVNSDGNFERKVWVFDADGADYEDIVNAVNAANELVLTEMFGDPKLEMMETTNHVSEEEHQNKPYVESIVYTTDEFKFINKDLETAKMNIVITVGSFAIGLLIFLVRHELFDYEYSEKIESIKERYVYPDTEDLSRKLSVRKDNLKRLKGDE